MLDEILDGAAVHADAHRISALQLSGRVAQIQCCKVLRLVLPMDVGRHLDDGVRDRGRILQTAGPVLTVNRSTAHVPLRYVGLGAAVAHADRQCFL